MVRPREGGRLSAGKNELGEVATALSCPFCGGTKIESDQASSFPYPTWRCACGAIGSGSILPDLDEVGDQLLETLGIDGRVSEPCIPTDNAALAFQHYDVNQVQRDLADIVSRFGYEFRIAPGQLPGGRNFWVRRNV
jgi:hypothetical protein